MKKLFKNLAVTLLTTFGMVGAALATPTYTYVGNWIVGDGPDWTSNPVVYSGQTAAALLFGGNATDYVTSTIDSNVANINFLTFLDGWGDTTYLSNPAADTYSLSSNGGNYNHSPSFSAYVRDHSCINRYYDPSQGCQEDGVQYVNYAFRASNSVPEPGSLALLGLALAGLAAARRRKSV